MYVQHSKKRHCILYPAAAATPAAAAATATAAGAPATRPAGLSVTPHAFDEFVCSSTVCTVLYVPYRAVGVSMQKHQPSYARPTEPASGLRHCSVWLVLVGPQRWAGEWSTTAARRRPLVSQRRGRDRSRPDRPQRARQACKASKALARGAVAKRSAQSSERHVSRCPEACACHGPRKELEQREGCV